MRVTRRIYARKLARLRAYLGASCGGVFPSAHLEGLEGKGSDGGAADFILTFCA